MKIIFSIIFISLCGYNGNSQSLSLGVSIFKLSNEERPTSYVAHNNIHAEETTIFYADSISKRMNYRFGLGYTESTDVASSELGDFTKYDVKYISLSIGFQYWLNSKIKRGLYLSPAIMPLYRVKSTELIGEIDMNGKRTSRQIDSPDAYSQILLFNKLALGFDFKIYKGFSGYVEYGIMVRVGKVDKSRKENAFFTPGYFLGLKYNFQEK